MNNGKVTFTGNPKVALINKSFFLEIKFVAVNLQICLIRQKDTVGVSVQILANETY